MAIDSYVVFTPYDGAPWEGEGTTAGLQDPFVAGLVPQAFFPVADWSMDVEQTLNIGSQSSGAGAGKISFNPFSITRKIDKVSPQLFLRAASGTPFRYVDLIERRTSGSHKAGVVFVAWRFGLTAVKTIAWVGGDETPKEVVTFEYGSLTIEYIPQLPDGSLGVPVIAGWDRVRNVAL